MAALIAVAIPVSMAGGVVGSARADSSHCTKGSLGWGNPSVSGSDGHVVFNNFGEINGCDQAFKITMRAQYLDGITGQWTSPVLSNGNPAILNLPSQSCGGNSPSSFGAGSDNTYTLVFGGVCGSNTSRAFAANSNQIAKTAENNTISLCKNQWRLHVDITSVGGTTGDLGFYNSTAKDSTC